jgi:hypothetical protein
MKIANAGAVQKCSFRIVALNLRSMDSGVFSRHHNGIQDGNDFNLI